MKKSVYSSLAVLILMMTSSAFAADEADHTKLTSKYYVDSGLRAVYQVAQYAADKVGLEADNEGPATGLIKDVTDLQGSISTLQDKVQNIENGSVYTATDGITIDQNNTIKLTAPKDGKRYLYQNGAWVELVTVDTWNSNVLTPEP